MHCFAFCKLGECAGDFSGVKCALRVMCDEGSDVVCANSEGSGALSCSAPPPINYRNKYQTANQDWLSSLAITVLHKV